MMYCVIRQIMDIRQNRSWMYDRFMSDKSGYKDAFLKGVDEFVSVGYDSPLPLSWHKWEVNCHNQLQSIGG